MISRDAQNHLLVLQNGPASIVGIIKQLCILAHIDCPKVVLSSQCNLRELKVIFAAGPQAVEISGDPNEIHDGSHCALIRDLPWVRGSDDHDSDYAGTRTCWLNMSEPNLDGLRNALLEQENCVLFCKQPPSEPSLCICNLKIRTRLCKIENDEVVYIHFSLFIML